MHVPRSIRISNPRHALRVGAALALGMGAFALASAAHADQCITSPVALPQLSGPPVWINPAGTDVWRAELNEPRWAGAPLFTLCSNADLSLCAPGTDQAQFRVLISGTWMYVAFHNLVDDSGPDSNDVVFVGVGQAGALLGGKVVRISPAGTPVVVPAGTPSDGTAPAPNPDASVVTWKASTADVPASWTAEKQALDPIPDWLKDIATWTGSPGVHWGVTLRIDLTKFGFAAPITAPLRVFFGSRHTPSIGSAVSLPNITTNTVAGSETIAPANRASWTQFSPPAAGCAAGITLDRNKIGIWDSGSSSLGGTVRTCPPAASPQPAGCPGRQHTLRVQPQNVPATSAMVSHGVRTNIRLANFGAVIDDWKNAPWNTIAGEGDPLHDATPGTGWAFTTSASGSPVMDFTCSVQAGQTYCPRLSNAAAQPDQCMLAELGGPPGVNLSFQNSAVYRNLWFQPLSTVDRIAAVDIRGLQAATSRPSDRDVYLYVDTKNMPPHSDEARRLPLETMATLRRYAENRPALPPYQDAKRPGVAGRVAVAASATAASANNLSPLSVPTFSDDQALGLAWPTYKVYAYYDSGEKVVINGTPRIALVPMVPFGFYLSHDGAFYGFSHSITGIDGATLEPLTPNWYRVRVKNESSIQVRTVVTAEERPKGAGGCPTCCDKPPPPIKVVIQPRCYCAVPGAAPRSTGSWALVLLSGTLAWARRRARTTTGIR